MKARNLLTIALAMVVGGLLLLGIQYFMKSDKTRYVSMSQVFEEAGISKKYRDELKQIEQQSNARLAEMENGIRELKKTGTDTETIGRMEEQLLAERDRLSEEYQRKSDAFDKIIWDQINLKVSEFGKEKGYDYIFGAKGDGSIMYASDSKDVTKELIEYINR